MSMQNVTRFLRDVDELEDLRHQIYLCEGYDELFALLASSGYPFTGAEFEEMVDRLHASCRTIEEAGLLLEKATWFRMLAANA